MRPIADGQEGWYAVLEPGSRDRALATLNNDVVGIQREDRRLTWFGLPLAATGGPSALEHSRTDDGQPALFLSLVRSFGIPCPLAVEGDPMIACRRVAKGGGALIFVLNLHRAVGRATVKPSWTLRSVTDLLHDRRPVPVAQNAFEVELKRGEVGVFAAG